MRTLGVAERRTALAQLVKRIGVYDPTPRPADEQEIVGAVADAVSAYEVTGHADVGRLTDVVLTAPGG